MILFQRTPKSCVVLYKMTSKLHKIRDTSTTVQHARLTREPVHEKIAGCSPNLLISANGSKSPGFPDEI